MWAIHPRAVLSLQEPTPVGDALHARPLAQGLRCDDHQAHQLFSKMTCPTAVLLAGTW